MEESKDLQQGSQQSSQENQNQKSVGLNALQQAMQAKANQEVVVNAEDLQDETRDWSKTFFEPEYGQTYTIKPLMNLTELPNVVHRQVYRSLPDPERKNKEFRAVYPGNPNASECPPLELFFDLYELKKNGNLLAEQKIDKYLNRTSQGAMLVQILASSDSKMVGKTRILVFATAGQNAKIAQLLNEKLNPTKAQIEAGFVKEDVFALTPTSVMVIDCQKASFDGVDGRDYSKSIWAKKEMGMRIYSGTDDDKNREIVYEFQKGDINTDFTFKPEAAPHFEKAIEILQNPDINILEQYAYKTPQTEGISDETRKYVTKMFEKVEKVIPIIRDAKSIGEIEQKLGRHGESKGDDAEVIGTKSKEDILKEAVPELDNAVNKKSDSQNVETTQSEKPAASSAEDVLKNVLGEENNQ